MSFESLSERLVALQESNSQLRELIDRLGNLKFQPGSVPLDNEDGNVMTELAVEIQQTLKEQDEDFELLQEQAYDLIAGKPGSEAHERKANLIDSIKRSTQELKSYHGAFRKAQLEARRNLQAAQRLERELLLQSYVNPPQSGDSSPAPSIRRVFRQQSEPSHADKEVNASSDITLALRRTHDMMAAELSRSQFAHDTLKESTAALAQLSESYSMLDTLLSSSKNLLGTLLRSQKSDTWYLETSFYILLGTIAWLIFRRWLYGPTWWLVWFPFKIFFRSLGGVLTAMGVLGGSASSAPSVSSVAAGQTLRVHNSATRAPFSTIIPQNPPSVNVGGGGRGAPIRSDAPQAEAHRQEPDTMAERVGRIIDESGAKEGEGSQPRQNEPVEEQPEVRRNPKKRMFEDPEAIAKEERKKDEL
ncbi:protein transport membrane glycoprotein-like protein Sec20 [Xylogone sp. PMI_703]|nr:protein transport membrane glycoprotein-like protein Sec20 [Xylogone sp. PMI_703]